MGINSNLFSKKYKRKIHTFHASYQVIHTCIDYINFRNKQLHGQLKLLGSPHSSPISTLALKPSFFWPQAQFFLASKPSFPYSQIKIKEK